MAKAGIRCRECESTIPQGYPALPSHVFTVSACNCSFYTLGFLRYLVPRTLRTVGSILIIDSLISQVFIIEMVLDFLHVGGDIHVFQ